MKMHMNHCSTRIKMRTQPAPFRFTAAALVIIPLAVCLYPAGARAYERQIQLGIDGGYSHIERGRNDLPGGGAGLHISYGIDDTWGVFISSFCSFMEPPPRPSDEEIVEAEEAGKELKWGEDTIIVGNVVAGAKYALDVFRVVPFMTLGVGPYFKRNEMGEFRVEWGFKLALGADYMIYRWLSAGAEVAYHGLVTDFMNVPVYLTLLARLSFQFDI